VAEEKGAETIRDKNRRIREEAAAKRRAKREGEKAAARRPTLGQLEASEIMDDAFARTTHAVTGWVRRNFTLVQWAAVALLVGGIGYQVFVYHRDKVMGRTTDALAIGVDQELSRIGDGPAEDDPRTGISDTRRTHKTNEERLAAAETEYRKVTEGETVRGLARLGLAGVLFDRGKYKEALTEYRSVKDGPLAQADSDVKARAIEGIGLSQEGAGDLEGAKKAFNELANQDSAQLSALGLYHQARLERQKGANDQAKEHLKKALKKIADGKLQQIYVEQVARQLLASIDPSALPPPSPQSLSPEQREQLQQIEKLKQEMLKTQKAAEEAAKAAGDVPKDLSPEAIEKLVKSMKMPQPLPSPSSSSGAP
jgi:predicted negative regulator of RcsB-dependent stress response